MGFWKGRCSCKCKGLNGRPDLQRQSQSKQTSVFSLKMRRILGVSQSPGGLQIAHGEAPSPHLRTSETLSQKKQPPRGGGLGVGKTELASILKTKGAGTPPNAPQGVKRMQRLPQGQSAVHSWNSQLCCIPAAAVTRDRGVPQGVPALWGPHHRPPRVPPGCAHH